LKLKCDELKLKCDELLSNVAFKFNLRRFNEAHLGYLSHAQAANEVARRRQKDNPHFATAIVQTPAPFPTQPPLDQRNPGGKGVGKTCSACKEAGYPGVPSTQLHRRECAYFKAKKQLQEAAAGRAAGGAGGA
jgi:hypothetical protein